MSSPMTRKLLVLGFVALTLTGCISAAAKGAKTQAATDFKCPEREIDVVDRGGDAYEATGCGRRATYQCAAHLGPSGRAEYPCSAIQPEVVQPDAGAQVANASHAASPMSVAPADAAPPSVSSQLAAPFGAGTSVVVTYADGTKVRAVVDAESADQVSVTLPNGQHQWVPRFSVTRYVGP
jgi:hypothetical protein